MSDDASPENLRKFLESDDPAMVRMGALEVTYEQAHRFTLRFSSPCGLGIAPNQA